MNYGTWMPSYGQPQPAWQPARPDIMQGYPQAQQMAPAQAQSQQQGFLTRPVASREEAVAAQIDFFGPGMLMPDFGHNCVYYKRFNQQTGSCDFLTFRLEQERPAAEPDTAPPAATEYVTREELEGVRSVILGLSEEIKTLRGGKRLADE